MSNSEDMHPICVGNCTGTQLWYVKALFTLIVVLALFWVIGDFSVLHFNYGVKEDEKEGQLRQQGRNRFRRFIGETTDQEAIRRTAFDATRRAFQKRTERIRETQVRCCCPALSTTSSSVCPHPACSRFAMVAHRLTSVVLFTTRSGHKQRRHGSKQRLVMRKRKDTSSLFRDVVALLQTSLLVSPSLSQARYWSLVEGGGTNRVLPAHRDRHLHLRAVVAVRPSFAASPSVRPVDVGRRHDAPEARLHAQ